MFVILDLETTGLNPGECDILELGILIVDIDQMDSEAVRSFSGVRHYSSSMRALTSPFIQSMHEKNGLWKDCEETEKTLAELEEEALVFLNHLAPEKTYPLTGSTISFDRAFLQQHMPKLEKWFHYRNIDVSSLRLLAEKFGKPIAPKGKELHRSLPDCVDTLKALEYYTKLFNLTKEDNQ